MGTWGTAIFADDTAADVRDLWREAILEGLSAEEATARVLEELGDPVQGDPHVEGVFWLALAAAQMETGRLQPGPRDRALAVIKSGADVARWAEEDPGLARQREEALERLAANLRGPQPKPKRIRPRGHLPNPLEVGDVVLVRNVEEGAEALFGVVDENLTREGEREPVVEALLWEGGELPDPVELAERTALLDEGVLGDVSERPPGQPIAPLQPLMFVVSTMSKSEVFGPHIGEVVAKGVSRAPSADFRARNEFGGDAYAIGCNWPFLVAWIAAEYYQRMVELTRAAIRGR